MDQAPARLKVPAIEVAAEAFRGVFGNLGLVMELGWLPILALLAAAILPKLFLSVAAADDGALFGMSASDLIEAVAAIICLNAFAVRWHQAVLFGRRTVPPGLFLRAFARFLLYTMALYLASLLVAAAILASGAAFGGAPQGHLLPLAIAAAAAVLLLWLAVARLALLFPAAAFGRPLGWAGAWRAMRGNAWRLVGCGVVACAPFVLTVGILMMMVLSAAHVAGAEGPVTPSLGLLLLRGVVDTLANFVVVALGASILSGFYRRIVLAGPRAP